MQLYAGSSKSIYAFVTSKYLQALHLAQELSKIFEQHLWTNKSQNISATFFDEFKSIKIKQFQLKKKLI